MSRIIKASRITGEYRLSDVKIEENELSSSDKKKDSTKEKPSSDEKKEVKEKVVKEAEEKAEEILDRARQEAEQITSSARMEAEEIKEKARQKGYDQGLEQGKKEGYEQGREEGYEDGISQLKESCDTLDQVIDKTRHDMKDRIEELPIEVIYLANQIASRIVNTRIEINPELINNIIIDILEEIGAAHEEIVIKVHPDHLNYIDQARVNSTLNQQKVEFVGDNSLEQGDCVIETEFGGKDATIDNKLELIKQKLYQGAGYHEQS